MKLPGTNDEQVRGICDLIRGIAANYPNGMAAIRAEVERNWPRLILGSTADDRERERRYQAHKDEFERTTGRWDPPSPAPTEPVKRGRGRPRKNPA